MTAVYRTLSGVLLVMVAGQVFLAGRATFTGSFEPHRALGHMLLPAALLLAVTGLVARAPWRNVVATAVVFVLVFLQPVLAGLGKGWGVDALSTGGLFFGLHALNAAVIVALLVFTVHRRIRPRPRRGERTAR